MTSAFRSTPMGETFRLLAPSIRERRELHSAAALELVQTTRGRYDR